MNWTGGRLQRHSKANGNATLKAQKQHFARARLQSQNGRPAPSPVRFSTFKVPLKVPPKADQDRSHGVKRRMNKDSAGGLTVEYLDGRPVDFSVSLDRSPKRRRLNPQPGKHHGYPHGRLEETGQLPERGPVIEVGAQHADRESRKSAHAERHTLDAVKRSLLRRSDWMGLNAARPLQMKFPSAQEMENIGRRRKITVNEKKKPEETRRKLFHYAAENHTFNCRQGPHRIDDNDIRNEVPSIRVGSNIHQSQPTPRPSQTHNPRSVIYQSESSESMLLDKEVSNCQQSIAVQSSPRSVMAASGPAEWHVREDLGMPLVSLDQIRDSETFDEVKAKSDSVAQLSSGKELQRSPKGPKRRSANRNSKSEQAKSSSVVNGRRLLQSRPSRSPPSDLQSNTKAHRPCQIPRQRHSQQGPDSLSNGFSPPDRGHGYGRGETAEMSSGGGQKPFSKSDDSMDASKPNHSMPRGSQNQPENRSKFTIEHQVEAEAEAKATDINCASIGQISHPDFPLQVARKNSTATSSFSLKQNENQIVSLAVYAPRKRQEANLTLSSPALTMAINRRTSAGDSNQKHLAKAHALRPSGRAPLSKMDGRIITPSFERLQASATPQDRGPERHSSRKKPMRQRLDISQQSAFGASNQVQTSGPQRDEDQAWMRFVLQDDPSAISNNFYVDNGSTRGAVGRAQRRLRCNTEDDETLPEHQQLQSSQIRNTNGFSPAQTIRTNANTAIYEPHANAEGTAQIRPQPSETDFLSQLSPMEGQLDERLLNPSIHTNVARTERSYVPTPSQTLGIYSNGIQSDFPEPHALDVNTSPPVRLPHNHLSPQTSSIHSSFDPPSHTATPSARRASNRTPLRPIPNLFTKPICSPIKSLQMTSNHLTNLSQTNSMIAQPSAAGSLGGEWIEQSSSTNGTPSSSHPPFQPPDIHGNFALSRIFNSTPPTDSYANQAHISTATSPRPHLRHLRLTTGTSSPLPPSSPDHFIFKKPPQHLTHNISTQPRDPPPLTAKQPNAPTLDSRAGSPLQHPRPTRQHLTPRWIEPFSTSGPVKSDVRAGRV